MKKSSYVFSMEVAPLARRELLSAGEKHTVTRMYLGAGKKDKPHSHPHEQTCYILAGEGTFALGGERTTLKAGDFVYVEGGTEHGFVEIREDVVMLECFAPVREDIVAAHLIK